MNKIWQQWLDSSLLTPVEKKEIKSLTNKEKEVYFSSIPLVFGTAGVRGKMGMGTIRMNRFTYANLAQAYAQYIIEKHGRNKAIVIGHDNRLDSDKFAMLVANVVSSFGIKVLLFVDNQLMPTPIVSYAVRQTNSVGGIIITASHNPKEYNGFKAYRDDGGQILNNDANIISKYLLKPHELLNYTYTHNKSLVKYLTNDVIDKYMHDARIVNINKKIIDKKKSYPVVFTSHHGTASKLLPTFLKSLNFNVIPVKQQNFVDSSFKNSPCSNPEVFESFNLSIKLANKVKSNIIIGVDPDADRMAVCIKHQDKWRLMTGNEMGILYTYYALKHKTYKKTPYIISTYVSTNLIDRIAKNYKAKVYRTPTGFKWMGARITSIGNKESFVVAFEEAIGALNTTINRDKDSFTASALALEIYDVYKSKGMDLVDILEKEIYPAFGHWFGKTDSYTFDVLNWKQKINNLMSKLKRYHSSTINTYKINKVLWNKDGQCLEWHLQNDSWIKFRASGTEPKFKIYYNLYGDDSPSLIKQYNKLVKIFNKIIGE